MAMLSRTHHISHRRERSISREPPTHHLAYDRSPLDYDYSGSISPSRKTGSHKNHGRNGDSHRNKWNHTNRQREKTQDRSQDRDWSRRHDGHNSRVQNRNRDNTYDDDLNDRLPYDNNIHKIDPTSQEWSRQADNYRGRRPQRDHVNYSHYETHRSNYNEITAGSIRDRNERRDYRQLDQTGNLRPKDKHHHSSYDRQLDIRQGDVTGRPRPQNQYYQSSSHRRRHYSPRPAPSPGKSPMRRPFKSHDFANENNDRYTKRRKLDYHLNRHVQNRRSSRSRNDRASHARSFTPSRSRSRTPSDYSRSRSLSKSRSRSQTRSRSNNRAKSRSCLRSHSRELDFPPARSPSPIPPLPPRPPKSKLRSTSRSQESDVLSRKSLRSTSSRQSPRHPRRPRSFRRSRTPPSEFSESSLDGRPCDMTTRSRSSRRTRSHSRRRSISPSVISGYSRTPSQGRSTPRSRSAHHSSDRRFSSSSIRHHRARSQSSSSRGHQSSHRSFQKSHAYRRGRVIESDLGPPPQPPRPPTGPRYAAQDKSSDRRARGSDRWVIDGSHRQKEFSLSPPPPSPPLLEPKLVLEDAPISNPVAAQAPLPVSSPPAIPKPPKSPQRLRSTVHSIRKAPGMPPIAPVAQTSAGVRRFFPGDDEDDDDEIPIEPTKSLTALLHSEEPEVPVELNPKPPSPSPPPLPPPPKSPLHSNQRQPSLPHWQQYASAKPSKTPPPPPPPPPPCAPPPPPPPLSPAEVTPTTFIAPNGTYNRQSTLSQPKRQFSSRPHHLEGASSDYWSTSSRKPFRRLPGRWPVRDVPPDSNMHPTHLVITHRHWEATTKVNPIDSSMHETALPPEVPLPVNVMPPGNQIPTGSTYTDSAYENHYPPSTTSHVVNQVFTPHQQFTGVSQPPNFSTDPQTTVQTQPTNGRRETKEIYERLVQVGEGTYGKVYKARNIETNELVAMKRIRMEAEKDGFPITAIREIKLLQGLHHSNIVNLVEMVVSKGHVYIVFEYMDHDLSGVLHHPSIHFTEAHTKSLMHQLLSGLKYMHEREVLHRDLKGSNILLNKLGQLKIADFGLARRFERGKEPGKEGRGRGRDYTNRVITLWYKPPELLFGATVYGEEVDMWSAGAIFLELFTRRPILQTADEIDQLHATFKLMGTPTEKNWPEAFNLPWFELLKPKVELPSKLRETFFGVDKHVKTEAGMILAEKLLSLRPDDRPSAREALKFPYFTIETPEMELPKDLLSNVKGEWHELESKRARRRRDI